MALDTHINDTDKNENKTNILGFFKRHYILTGFLIVIIAITGWWKYNYISASWRYKLTVTIETPEGLKSGSSVYEMSNSDSNIKILSFPESGNPATIRGEAIMIDLEKRGIIFGLIPSEYLLYSAIPVPNGGETTPKGIRYYKNLKDIKVTLKPNLYPTFVTFTDIKNPKTVTQVDPLNLSANFGEGVKLKDITIEMTDEDVTWGIDKYLVWLNDLEIKMARLNGSTSIAISTNDLSDNLGPGSFKIGDKK